MTPLQKRIDKSYRLVQRKADAIFQTFAAEIGSKIEDAGQDVTGIVAANVSSFDDKVPYLKLRSTGILKRIQSQVHERLELLADEICDDWSEARKTYDMLSRVAMSYIGRKSSPPWESVTLNLRDTLRIPKDGDIDPRTGRIHAQMSRLADQIVDNVRKGALADEGSSQIVTRVRLMFKRTELKEAANLPKTKKVLKTKTEKDPSIEIEEGVYTEDELKDLIARAQKANGWEYRQYRPWFTDSLKRRNKIMADLERGLMADAVSLLHQGELQIGPEQMGVEDFVWKTNRQETTCEICSKRNEKTMRWISKNMKDKFRDLPPPLHPNCNCELVPQISEEWSESVLKNNDLEWDPNDGAVYKADKKERTIGVEDMTFDEYMQNFLG